MFKLPELEYSYDALEPHIDTETMKIHHTKHHAGYIDKLNRALSNFNVDPKMTIEQVVRSLHNYVPTDLYWDIRHNAGGHMNHTLFFQMMSPKGGGEPKGELAERLKQAFGGFKGFQERFTSSAMSRFGSGWAWLLLDEKDNIFIKSTANQDCPMTERKKILLGIDVWEHAYYLNYQNKRAEYIEKWWNVVNWEFVEARYRLLKKKR